jgi:hypothetical protein
VQGRVASGTLDHAGQCGGFCQRQLLQFFPEVKTGGLSHAARGYSAALSQVNLIAIQCKDFIFGQPLLDGKRQHCFRILAL